METVGTSPVGMIVSSLIPLAILALLAWGAWRLFRLARGNAIARGTIVVVMVALVAVLVTGYSYLGALGRGMAL